MEGGGGGQVARGLLDVHYIWWLLRCSHLVVLLCIALCPIGAHLTTMCGAALFPVALCVCSSQSGALFSCASALTAAGVRCGGGSMSLPASSCGCWVVVLSFGWHKGHLALLHMSPNLQRGVCVPPNLVLFFLVLAHSPLPVCAAGGAACRSLPPVVAVGLSYCHLGGTRGTWHFYTCLQICKPTGVCWGCFVVRVVHCCSCGFWAAEGLTI